MSINKVTIFGHLGRDPEVTYTVNGKAITKITVATSEKWKDSQGQQQERTEWHRIVFFGDQAELVGRSFWKGARIYVEGKIQTSTYEKNGEKRYSTEILAREFYYIEKKQDQPIDPNTFIQNQNVQGGFNQQQPQQQQPGFTQDFQRPNDDIPF